MHSFVTKWIKYEKRPIRLRNTATHCNTLQHTATRQEPSRRHDPMHLQDTATHCNALHHPATHRITLQHAASMQEPITASKSMCNRLQHTTIHCNTQQHTLMSAEAELSIQFLSGSVNTISRSHAQIRVSNTALTLTRRLVRLHSGQLSRNNG